MRTISSAKKHAPIHVPVTFTPNPRLSNSSAKSIKKREKSDNATLPETLFNRVPLRKYFTHPDSCPYITIQILTYPFPSIPYSFIFCHKPSLQTLGNAFFKSKNAIHVFLPWLLLICPIPLTAKTWSVVLLFLLKPPLSLPQYFTFDYLWQSSI